MTIETIDYLLDNQRLELIVIHEERIKRFVFDKNHELKVWRDDMKQVTKPSEIEMEDLAKAIKELSEKALKVKEILDKNI